MFTGIRSRVRRVDSGVCARMAEFLKILIVGLSERLKLESDEEGRDGVCKCTVGTGIIERLGGRGGCEGDESAEADNAGENAL